MSQEYQSFLQRFFEPVVNQPRMYFLGMVTIASRFAFDLMIVWIMKIVADAVEIGDYQYIQTLVVRFGGVMVVYYAVKYTTRKLGRAWSRYAIAKYISKKNQTKFFDLDYTYVEKFGIGRITSIIQDGERSWIDALCQLQYFIPNISIKIGFTLFLLGQIGWQYLVLFFVLFVFVYIYVIRINNRYVVPLRKDRKVFAIRRSRQFVRMIMSKQEMLQNAKIDREIEGYQESINKQQSINYVIVGFIYFMFNVPLFIVHSLSIVLMIYAYTSIQQGTFSFGFFTALVAMIGYLSQIMLRGTEVFKNLSDQYIHIEKMRDFFDQGPVMKGMHVGKNFEYKQGSMKLSNLCFAYNENEVVFDDFSIQISGGKTTALVGVSGGGKSTLVKLIAGYLKPDQGSIIIDGQDLQNVALQTYYKHIGYLTQEPSIFDGTVRDNLTYALHEDSSALGNAMTDRIDNAIKSAKCEFVYDFKDGLDTEIGERGVRLSGGQRQRLAIAKIFLKNPEIIILDEPTSALDSFSEEAITEAMKNLFSGRTVIIIAHRLQTVKNADDIILLEGGDIVERGVHDQLIAAGGRYAKMLELQSGF